MLPADDRLKLAVLGKLIVTASQLHTKKLIIQIYKVVCNRANVWRQLSVSMQQYGIVQASLRQLKLLSAVADVAGSLQLSATELTAQDVEIGLGMELL